MQTKLKRLVQHPEFTPSSMEPRAARVFCNWVHTIHKYAVMHETTSKREKASDSSSKLDQSQKVVRSMVI